MNEKFNADYWAALIVQFFYKSIFDKILVIAHLFPWLVYLVLPQFQKGVCACGNI